MIKHINITVFGRVQGVLFRYSTEEEANKLSLKGYAKNTEDGSVYIEAEGEEENLKELVNWCKNGPQLAKVENIEVNLGEIKNFKTFETF